MHLEVFASADEAAARVVEMLVNRLTTKPTTVLGLPTGATPLPVYKLLIQAIDRRQCTLGQATIFNLDEYFGVGPDDPRSYAHYMRAALFDHVNHRSDRINIPNGLAEDPRAESSRYEAAISAAGGIDLMLLGLGRNGHIGFNEPGSPAMSRTRLVALTDNTLSANARYFRPDAPAPRSAITMGIATILSARQIVLLVTGQSKAEALRQTLEDPVSMQMPSSALQLHNDVVVVADSGAASKLSVADGSRKGTAGSRERAQPEAMGVRSL